MNTKIQKTRSKISGITLIALVITIIVLLILAGVTIGTLTGDNGILNKAQEAKIETEKTEIIEQINLEIIGNKIETENYGDSTITQGKLEELLSKYGDINYNEDGTIKSLTTEKNYEIPIEEIYPYEIEMEKNVQGYAINIPNAREQKIENLVIYGDTLNDGTALGSEGNIILKVTGKNIISDSNANQEVEMQESGISRPEPSYSRYEYAISTGNSGLVIDNENEYTISFYLKKYDDMINSERYFNSIVIGGKVGGDVWELRDFYSSFKQIPSDDGWIKFESTQKYSQLEFFQQNQILFILETEEGYQHIKVKNVQFEYANKATDYEDYKERAYEIKLKDESGNIIKGLNKNEKIQKVNGKWVIIKSDNTNVNLDENANKVLDSITLYNGVSNVYIEGNKPKDGHLHDTNRLNSYLEFKYKAII